MVGVRCLLLCLHISKDDVFVLLHVSHRNLKVLEPTGTSRLFEAYLQEPVQSSGETSPLKQRIHLVKTDTRGPTVLRMYSTLRLIKFLRNF